MSIRDFSPQVRDDSRPTVFYDGGCPLCSREIAHYRRLDLNDKLRWVDITRDGDVLGLYGLNLETAMQRFHVLDARGHWQTGAWGFAEMWAHLPRYRRLSQFLRFTRVLPLLDPLYSLFARGRARRRCSDRCLPPQGTGR